MGVGLAVSRNFRASAVSRGRSPFQRRLDDMTRGVGVTRPLFQRGDHYDPGAERISS